MKPRKVFIILITNVLGVLLAFQIKAYAQATETNGNTETEKKPTEPNKTYRIISGRNYDINLLDGSKFIYFVPLNYKVVDERGLGMPGENQKLQKTEKPATLSIGNVGMSIIGIINQKELYISLFVSGVLPSKCHTIKVENKKENSQNGIVVNTLIYSGINRKKLCVTKMTPIEASFILPNKLEPNVPQRLKINYEDYATVKWDGNTLHINKNELQWKITRINDILRQKPINNRWMREWVEGKKNKNKPTSKPTGNRRESQRTSKPEPVPKPEPVNSNNQNQPPN